MVYVRKLMEKCFSEKDLKYLDDKMPDFHLRKREDMKQKRMSGEIAIDLDENQGTIHAVNLFSIWKTHSDKFKRKNTGE